jgi:hypothetical protein
VQGKGSLPGEIVRSEHGGTIKLADGSLVEVRSESELSFEGAKSAVQINLSRGGVIVNSETQPVVKTRDIKVPITPEEGKIPSSSNMCGTKSRQAHVLQTWVLWRGRPFYRYPDSRSPGRPARCG